MAASEVRGDPDLRPKGKYLDRLTFEENYPSYRKHLEGFLSKRTHYDLPLAEDLAAEALTTLLEILRNEGGRILVENSKEQFRADAFKDLAGLAAKLRDAADPVSAYVRGRFSPHTRRLLKECGGRDALPESLGARLVDELNQLLNGPCLFEAQRFARVKLPKRITEAINRGPLGEELIGLNRELLEHAYPCEIRKRIANVLGYLRTTATNGLNDVSGRRGREEQLESDGEEGGPKSRQRRILDDKAMKRSKESIAAQEMDILVRQVFGDLHPKSIRRGLSEYERQLLQLTGEGKSADEIAEIVGRPVEQVKYHLKKVKARIGARVKGAIIRKVGRGRRD